MVKPRWTYVFLAINAIVYVAVTLTGGNQSSIVSFGANDAALVAQGEFWRLLTANFVHISIVHFLFNMYALYAIGTQVEALFGRSRFITIYLISGVSGAIFSYILTHGLSIGASTSLFGLFGALVVYFYKNRDLFGQLAQQQLIGLGVTLLINVMLGLTPGSNIDNFGHLGGFVGGLVLGWFLCPRYERVDPFARAFEPAIAARRRPELSNEMLTDTNSLAKQTFSVMLFSFVLLGLTIAATLLRSQ
jgi:rhomboid protease GluP